MTKDDQIVLCEHLVTEIEPIIHGSATRLLRLLMKIFIPRLNNCNEEQFTQIFLEASALACHVSNIESLIISEE